MSSLRRIQSSRANGARSHGPVSIAGKQASSMNGLRHGMLAQTVVLTGESKTRFVALLEALVDEYHPATESEAGLVEAMAVARWRQMRVWGIEKSDLDREMSRHAGPAPIRAAIAFRHLSDNSRSMDLYMRYEARFERQFQNSLISLLKRQAARPEMEEDEHAPLSPASATWETEEETEQRESETLPSSLATSCPDASQATRHRPPTDPTVKPGTSLTN